MSDVPSHDRTGLTEAELGPDPLVRLVAWASRQSLPVGSRQELDAAFAEVAGRFRGEDVPLPPHWGGYRLEPETIEFRQGREHRLHDRFRFTRVGGDWRVERLSP